MKEGICRQHFPDNNEAVITAVTKRDTSAGADFYKHRCRLLFKADENA
jgi:hypothetical protein